MLQNAEIWFTSWWGSCIPVFVGGDTCLPTVAIFCFSKQLAKNQPQPPKKTKKHPNMLPAKCVNLSFRKGTKSILVYKKALISCQNGWAFWYRKTIEKAFYIILLNLTAYLGCIVFHQHSTTTSSCRCFHGSSLNTASGQWPGYQFSNFQFDTVDGWNPKQPPFGCKKSLVNNGINYQPQLVGAGFLNHQQ